MAIINESSILAKIKEFERSSAGQKKMRTAYNQMVRSGSKKKTSGGSEIVTEQKAIELANRLAESIKATAASTGMSQSVLDDVNSITVGEVKMMPDGSFSAELNFTADRFRPSLRPDKYDGIDNIVALFNNGYPYTAAKYHVIGEWHGQKGVRGQPKRTGLHFMNTAVNDFNSTYGAKYNVFAELSGEYE